MDYPSVYPIVRLRRRPRCDASFLDGVGISSLLKRIYAARGVSSKDELEDGLEALQTYHSIPGIRAGTRLLSSAVEKRRTIAVVGDFDVDGATGTALLVLALRRMGVSSVRFFVPNRLGNDYGLTPPLVEQAKRQGARLIVTVDNGISSFAGTDFANAQGIAVLITDHHPPGDRLPDADAVVNPRLGTEKHPLRHLSGVGVAFYLMLSLRADLDTRRWFGRRNLAFPRLSDLLDLVAFGTLSDLVCLDRNNRILVRHGIRRIRSGRCRLGISALLRSLGKQHAQVGAHDIVFSLGPRINAAGRIDDMSVGVSLLLTKDQREAERLVKTLNRLNTVRQTIECGMEDTAYAMCEEMLAADPCLSGLVVYHADWHPGVVGILASKLKERFRRPTVVLASSGRGRLKGSARSVDSVDIRSLLEQVRALCPRSVVECGGHRMAAGLTIVDDRLPMFRRAFAALSAQWMRTHAPEHLVWSDGSLRPHELTLETARSVCGGSEPWGAGFPAPVFDGRFRILNQRLIARRHLRLLLELIPEGPVCDGIVFNVDRRVWPDPTVRFGVVAYQLNVNRFRENSKLQLVVQHLWPLPRGRVGC